MTELHYDETCRCRHRCIEGYAIDGRRPCMRCNRFIAPDEDVAKLKRKAERKRIAERESRLKRMRGGLNPDGSSSSGRLIDQQPIPRRVAS